MDHASGPPVYKHIVIVHGIGDQVPNETSLNFMNQFLRALPVGTDYALNVHSLIQDVHAPHGRANARFEPSFVEFSSRHRRYIIGFSEVFWQDITNSFLAGEEKRPPIPIFIWAHSINTRLLNRSAHDFYQARDAIDNLESMLGIVKWIALLSRRSRQFLDILNHFLGDVQMYTESSQIRKTIDERFCSVLSRVEECRKLTAAQLNCQFPGEPEIYIVAHSEGTVVSYRNLVAARHSRAQWFGQVRGLVTLGSPLDKHYTIWNNVFSIDTGVTELPESARIRWFNYWDVSDPVGYGLAPLLDGAAGNTDASKLFTICYDRGFARYVIPGLAHVKYWEDSKIYENIIDKVMGMGSTRDTRVTSRWFGHGPIQRIGDWAAYCVLRISAVGLAIFFLSHLMQGVRLPWPFPTGWDSIWSEATLLLAPLLACKLLWEVYTRTMGWIAKAALLLRALLWAGWLLLVLAVARTWANPAADLPDAKSVCGYLAGLAGVVLGWRLHTHVQKGLIQLWRYTKRHTRHAPENEAAYEGRTAAAKASRG